MSIRKYSYVVRLELDDRVVFSVDRNDEWNIITIGSASDNTWQVKSDQVNPHHARIEKRKTGLFIEYLGRDEKNGIYLLGDRVKGRIEVRPGVIYRIGRGNCKLTVEKILQSTVKTEERHHRLEQLTGENKGKIYQVMKKAAAGNDAGAGNGHEGEIVIGSDDTADIVIQEEWISRRHVSLEVNEEGCFIYDGYFDPDKKVWRPSRNGTKVNQEIVQTKQTGVPGRQLQDGQIISIAHVDLRFWDKNAVHVRSHFFLRLAIVLMTLAIVFGGYFMVLSTLPSARKYRIEAEAYAANERFDEARKLVKLSSDARGAEDDSVQRREFLRKLDLWEKTFDQWKIINKKLQAESGQDWNEINGMFASLISSDNENWRWNSTTAPQEMKTAQSAQGLISAILTAEDFLRTSNNDFAYLDRIRTELSRCSEAFAGFQTQFPALLAKSNDIRDELELTQQDYRELSNAITAYTSADMAQDVYESIKKIKSRNAARTAARKEKGLAASSAVMEHCDDFLNPLEKMSKAEKVLNKNYQEIANMKYDRVSGDLSLPTAQEFMVAKNLADRCAEMQQTLERQNQIVQQLRYYGDRLKAIQFDEDRIPPVLADLFDEKKLENVLNCDCLKKKLPGFEEKESVGDYDSILGVYVFYEYLDSLEEGAVFDTAVFNDRFRPVLFRTREVYDLLRSFVDFCHPVDRDSRYFNDMKIIRDISSGDNPLNDLTVRANELAGSKRKQNIGELLERMEDYYPELAEEDAGLRREFTGDERKGIILGGMICWLKGSSDDFIPDDLNLRVYKAHRELHQELLRLQNRNRERTLEEQKKDEEKILAIGIPGDSILNQQWNRLSPK